MSNAMASHPIAHQPMSLSSMDPYYDHYRDEKNVKTPACTSHDCECSNSTSSHSACHKSRLRRLFIPVLISIVTIAAIVFISCVNDLTALGVFGSDDGLLGLGKRALGARDSTGTNNGSSFVNNKCQCFASAQALGGTVLTCIDCFSISHRYIRWVITCARFCNNAQRVVLQRYVAPPSRFVGQSQTN
jgi:hypothetical protein